LIFRPAISRDVFILHAMKKTIRCSLVFLLSLLLLQSKAQQIDSVMNVMDEQFPKEKIHIHFDRTIYNQQETIFYKVYLLIGHNEWSMVSKNMYVAWYDTSGALLKQTAAPLFQSTAKGSFDIPAGYKGDFIRVKAFTRWMMNEDSAYFSKKIFRSIRGVLCLLRNRLLKPK